MGHPQIKDPIIPKPTGYRTIKVYPPVKYWEVGGEITTRFKSRPLIQQMIEDLPATHSVDISGTPLDHNYCLYPKSVILKQEKQLPSMYEMRPDREPYLVRDEDRGTAPAREFWDCDDNGLEFLYWYNLMLPGICMFECTGRRGMSAHQFCGILTKERELLWIGTGRAYGVADHPDPTYERYYGFRL